MKLKLKPRYKHYHYHKKKFGAKNFFNSCCNLKNLILVLTTGIFESDVDFVI